MFDPAPEVPDYEILPEYANIRPGGFNWQQAHPDVEDDANR